MSERHLGIARFHYRDRAIPLRFTLRRMTEGWDATVKLLEQSLTQGPEAGPALGRLLEMASGGEVGAGEVLDDFSGMDFASGLGAVHEAWALFRFGPSMKAPEGSGNPLNRLWTLMKRIWRRLFSRA